MPEMVQGRLVYAPPDPRPSCVSKEALDWAMVELELSDLTHCGLKRRAESQGISPLGTRDELHTRLTQEEV